MKVIPMKKLVLTGLILLTSYLAHAELYNDHVDGALSSNLRLFSKNELEEIQRNAMLDKKYTNTKFLAQYDKVRTELKKDFGFKEKSIPSEDQSIQCDALVRSRPEAKYTVILAPGFFKGRGEGNGGALCALSQFKNKENPYGINIIVLHTRYHGPKGKGRNLLKLLSPSNVFNLGEHEYKDLIATYNYTAQFFPGTEILGFGVCAGAFNMINAHKTMTNQAEQEQTIKEASKDDKKVAANILPKIKGYWFDSPWVDRPTTLKLTLQHEVLPKRYHVTGAITLPTFIPTLVNPLLKGALIASACMLHASPISRNPESTQNTDQAFIDIKIPVVCCASKDDPTTPLQSILPVINKRLESGRPTFLLEPDYQAATQKKTKVRHTESFVKQYERSKLLLHCWLNNPQKKPTMPYTPEPPKQSQLSAIKQLERW